MIPYDVKTNHGLWFWGSRVTPLNMSNDGVSFGLNINQAILQLHTIKAWGHLVKVWFMGCHCAALQSFQVIRGVNSTLSDHLISMHVLFVRFFFATYVNVLFFLICSFLNVFCLCCKCNMMTSTFTIWPLYIKVFQFEENLGFHFSVFASVRWV